MANQPNSQTDPVYQIKIKGHLGRQWTAWFEGMTITWTDNGETILTGPIVDQAALYGLLRKVRDLGLPLISVMQVKSGQSATVRLFDEIYQSQSIKGDKL